jgi:ribose 5-phosphate isomerase A
MFNELSASERAKYVCALRAAQMVKSGMKVGLGTGSTVYWLVKHLGKMVREDGLQIQGVPTSSRTAAQAREEGIDVITLDQAGWLDLTIDGADEFDADFNLIKGGGGAHLQEKVVAMGSDKMVVIADASKRVATLGAFPLPVEILQFGANATQKLVGHVLHDLGYAGVEMAVRHVDGSPFVTDEGNYVLDLKMGAITDAAALSNALNQLPGVVENGLFINICQAVIVGNADGRVTTEWKDGTATEVTQMMPDTVENLFADIEE